MGSLCGVGVLVLVTLWVESPFGGPGCVVVDGVPDWVDGRGSGLSLWSFTVPGVSDCGGGMSALEAVGGGVTVMVPVGGVVVSSSM